MEKKSIVLLIGVAAAGSLLALSQHVSFGGKPEKAAAAKQPPLVSIATARTRDLPVTFAVQGHLVPLNQVDMRPQMTGIIQKVHFHEGDQVKVGQLLFTLDATDAAAQLDRAHAQAAQIKAQLDDAQRDYKRSTEMVKSGFMSPSTVDTAASKVESLEAQLKAAQAGVESARVQLEHTRIHSPIDAQAGALNVHPGSLAQPGTSLPLVTLAQFDPIGVEFSLPEQYLNTLLAARKQEQVTIALDAPDGKNVAGDLSFVNYTVSTDSGTIRLKASFPNRNRSLWPGTFARITLGAGVSKDAVVLPPQAVLEGPAGRFVYLVGEDGKAASRKVRLLRVQDEDAVVDGVKAGERVVLEGAQDLRNGMSVRIAGKEKMPAERTDKLAVTTSSESGK
jgi:RND family efflux transporter MFP subunit